MANKNISQLDAILHGDVAGGDLFALWDTSASVTKKITATEFLKYFGIDGTGLTISNIQAETTDVDKFLVSNGGLVKYRTGAQLLSDIGGQATLVSGTNIKTINGSSVLGSGNLTISASVTSPLTLTAGTTSETVLTLAGNGASYTGKLFIAKDLSAAIRTKLDKDGNVVLGGDFNQFNGSNSTLLTLVPGGSQGSNALAITDGGSNYFIMRRQELYANNDVSLRVYAAGKPTSGIQIKAGISSVGGVIVIDNLPTAATGLPTGALWNNSGVLNVV